MPSWTYKTVNLFLPYIKNVYERTSRGVIHWLYRMREKWTRATITRNCPKLKYNQTYTSRRWIMTDRFVILIEPKKHLYEWIKKMDNFCVGCKTLFLNDDIIADNTLDEKRQPLLELAISGRHRNHSLWLLTQCYHEQFKTTSTDDLCLVS